MNRVGKTQVQCTDKRRLVFVIRGALLAALAFLLLFVSVTGTQAQEPGQVPRKFDPAQIKLQPGYHIEVLIDNLSVLTTGIFDGKDLLLAESGWANTAPPRILRITPDWQVQVVASEGLQAPVTGLAMVNGKLYVSHKDKVSVLDGGALKDVVTDLPSNGDHQNNNIVLGPDGKLYMGQGTTTNSAVVGVDNYIFGWLPEHPEAHEIPCQDITLVGQNFESENPLTPDANDKVMTGAYKPFGTPSTPGEVIKGSPKCGGSIVRFNPDGSDFELYAWGMRNPFGLKFDANGQLWATYHGADVRGSRNIYNDPDYLVKVEQGAWYGWPEYFDGTPVTEARFQAPGKEQPQFLWQSHPPLTKAFAKFGTHEGINGLALSPGGAFGYPNNAFIAMFGTFAPVTTGVNIEPVGFRVVRADLTTGESADFASNLIPGPGYVTQHEGLDRPSDVVFAPDGSLYVMDWGAATITLEGLKLSPNTGAVWRIYSESMQPLRPNGPLVVPSAPTIPPEERKPEVRNVPELYKMLAPEILGIVALILAVVVVAFVFVMRWARR